MSLGPLETFRSPAPRRWPVVAAVVSGETRSKKSSYALGHGSPRPAASQSCFSTLPSVLSAIRAGPPMSRATAMNGPRWPDRGSQAGGPTRWGPSSRRIRPGDPCTTPVFIPGSWRPVPGLVLVSATSMRLPELHAAIVLGVVQAAAERQRRWPLSSSPPNATSGRTDDRPFAGRASRASSRASRYRERCMTAGVFEVGATQSEML